MKPQSPWALSVLLRILGRRLVDAGLFVTVMGATYLVVHAIFLGATP